LRRQALNANREPGVRRQGPCVEANAGDGLPPWAERAAVQDLRFRRIEHAATRLALGANQESMPIAADPRAGVPARSRLTVHELRFELVEQHLEVDGAIVDGVAAVIDF